MASPNPLEFTVIQKLWESSINYINHLLTTFVPGGEVYETAIISFIVAYAIKSKNRWGTASLIATTVIIFSSFRYFGIGGH